MSRRGFEDGHFDVVVCQFGLMFVPDELATLREARRRAIEAAYGSPVKTRIAALVAEASA